MFSPHVRNQRTLVLPVPADAAFQLFTPRGEEFWIDDWRPRYLHPLDGKTAEGMVFTTGQGAEFTLWQLIVFDRQRRKSVYARTTPGLRLGTVTVEVSAVDDLHSSVKVKYNMTALADSDTALGAYRDPDFAAMIDGWGRTIEGLLPELIYRLDQ